MKHLALIAILSSAVFAQSTTYYKNVKVISSKPVKTTIEKRIPYQACYDEDFYEQIPVQKNEDTNSIGLDTIIGTTLGVVIGNQVGKGNGRTAAKIIGGIGGGYAANQMRNVPTETETVKRTRKKCVKKYEITQEEITSHYKNYFILDGEKKVKTSEYPLKNIKVKYTISY